MAAFVILPPPMGSSVMFGEMASLSFFVRSAVTTERQIKRSWEEKGTTEFIGVV